jgi:hypothetical protein
MTHDNQHFPVRRSAPDVLASAISALRGLPFSDAWLRLVGSGAPGGFAAKVIETCVYAHEASPAIGLVLLDDLPKLLVAIGSGVLSHG